MLICNEIKYNEYDSINLVMKLIIMIMIHVNSIMKLKMNMIIHINLLMKLNTVYAIICKTEML